MDSSGAGVAGASVRAIRLRGESPSGLGVERHVIAQTTSGSDGRFALGISRLRRHLWIEAEAADRAVGSSYLEDFLSTKQITVVLDDPARIEGTVIAQASGAPLAGIEVEMGDGRFSYGTVATTDRNGRFVVPNAPQPPLVLGASPGGYAPIAVEIDDEVREPLVLSVSEGLTVGGRVRARDTGKAIAGAAVGTSSWPRRAVRTDEEGNYNLDGIAVDGDAPAGYLIVQAAGYARERVDLAERIPSNLELPRVDVFLESGVTITGAVISDHDGPVDDADVEVLALNAEALAETNAQGRFELRDLRPAETLDFLGFWITASGHYVTELEPVVAASPGVHDIGTVIVVARPPHMISVFGTVSGDASGRMPPVVECWRNVPRGRARIDIRTCDSQGRFELQAPAEAPLLVQAKSGARRSQIVEVTVARANVTLDVPLTLGP